MRQNLQLTRALGGLAIAAALAAGCKPGDKPLAETETRQVARPEMPAQVTDRVRFGAEAAMPGGMGSAGGAGGAMPGGGENVQNAGMPAAPGGAVEFSYKLPSGWKELAPTEFRNLNFSFGSAGDGQCYVSVLPGAGGGLLDNVNRWRKQMGAAPLQQADMADLPTIELLGGQAVYLEMAGDFAGMMGNGAMKGAMLLGALGKDANGAGVFVKLVAPKAEAEKQRDAFKAFCASLQEKGAPATGAAADAAMPGAPAAGDAMQSSAANGNVPFNMPTGASGADRLEYTTPAKWADQPAGQMRAASFSVPGAGGAAAVGDCSVFLMPGAAGGVSANVNRWRNQMGLAPLDDAAIEKLPSAPIAGTQGKLVELEGSFTGMSGAPQAGSGLLGVVCELSGETLFVKLTGPAATVSAARADFLNFCKNLKLKPKA